MTAKPIALALSLLLLGGTAARAGGVQMAELVPVEPSWPGMMYAPPAPEPPAPSAKPAAKAEAGKAEAAKGGPAALEDGWQGGPAKDKDGKFSYCMVEGRFDSGHILMVARNPKGELNLGIGIPGAELPKGQDWKVKIAIDGKLSRERLAFAPQPDMLVIPNGRDEELYSAMMSGKELVFTSSADRIAFALKGTKKVLTDLKTCVEKSGNVPPIDTATKGAAPKNGLPEGLADLLAAAGLREVEPIPLDKLPKEERPADLAWRFGPIVGGIRERLVGEGATLPELSDAFAEAMTKRCDGKAAVALNPVETLPGVALRTGAVDCAMKGGTLHVSLTFFLSSARLFTVLFHESGEADRGLADKVRDNLAEILRQLAAAPPPKP